MVRIMLVEDNDVNRDMLSRRLTKRGNEVINAVNGQQCLDLVTKEEPDIILLDMSLPVLDGWETARRLKGDPATKDIPIIALTAHAMAGDREKCIEAGCEEYATKPVEFKQLIVKINSLIDGEASS